MHPTNTDDHGEGSCRLARGPAEVRDSGFILTVSVGVALVSTGIHAAVVGVADAGITPFLLLAGAAPIPMIMIG